MNDDWLKPTVFSLIILFISPVQAAWYQVEVIVFENLESETDGELWYENPGLPDRSNSIELITALADSEQDLPVPKIEEQAEENQQGSEELIPYFQLPKDAMKMEGIYRILKLSREYRPLMHVSWQQPGLNAQSARAVHIQKFEEPVEATTGAPNSGNTDQFYQVLDLIFDGTIRLRSSRFLHVDVDIAFFPELLTNEKKISAEEGTLFVAQQADYVRLQESRKIKLNEIHYFDHPLFGGIVRVSRLIRK